MTLHLAQALQRLPGPAGERYARLLQHGSMSVEVYAPRGHDPQQPHAQDELYFIQQGRGQLVIGDERHDCAPGDAFFVPAGQTHRFEHFSDDFATWVVFWGPPGGERP